MNREATCKVLDMAENGVLNWETIARECLEYMSEDDVRDMAESNDWIDDDDEIWEDDEDDDYDEDEHECCICHEHFSGYGNNANPVVDGICCDKCNAQVVIPCRLKDAIS